ncbi:MAG TPA: hypothetical protein VGD33_08945, partial [Chitinophagaceae bacterium]
PAGMHPGNGNAQNHTRKTMDAHWAAADGDLIGIKSEYIYAVKNDPNGFPAIESGNFPGLVRHHFPVNFHQGITQQIGIVKYEFLVSECPCTVIIEPEIIFCVIIAPGSFCFFIQAVEFINGLVVVERIMIPGCRELGHFIFEHFSPDAVAKGFVIVDSHFKFDHAAADELLGITAEANQYKEG